MNPAAVEHPRPGARVCMYVGQSQTGKTHLALAHLATRADGLPALILDSMGAANFASSPHRVETASAALQRVFGERRHAVVTPWDEEEAAILFEAAGDLGNAHLFVDESSEWLTARSSVRPLRRCLRAPSHRRLTVALTTQYFSGDAPKFLFECDAAFYVFRTNGFDARRRLAEEFDDADLPAVVKSLPDRICVRVPRPTRAAPPG